MEGVELTDTIISYTDDMWSYKLGKEATDSQKKEFNGSRKEADLWNALTYKTTPSEFIEERVGSKGKMLEYIRQFYVIRELNRLFPGWRVSNWKLWYQPEVRTWVFTGNLVITYFSMRTEKWTKRPIPGIGAAYVHSKTSDDGAPSQPDDMAKSTRTEFIKNAAYWLGIGFDVYSQEIPLSLVSRFEDLIRQWEVKDYVLEVAETITKRKAFETFVDNLPQEDDTSKFIELIGRAKGDKTKLWLDFQKQNRNTVKNWLNQYETFLNKQQQTNGVTNG